MLPGADLMSYCKILQHMLLFCNSCCVFRQLITCLRREIRAQKEKVKEFKEKEQAVKVKRA